MIRDLARWRTFKAAYIPVGGTTGLNAPAGAAGLAFVQLTDNINAPGWRLRRRPSRVEAPGYGRSVFDPNRSAPYSPPRRYAPVRVVVEVILEFQHLHGTGSTPSSLDSWPERGARAFDHKSRFLRLIFRPFQEARGHLR